MNRNLIVSTKKFLRELILQFTIMYAKINSIADSILLVLNNVQKIYIERDFF